MTAPFHESLVATAERHPAIQVYRQGPWAEIWSPLSLSASPPLVLVCRFGQIIGTWSDVVSYVVRHWRRFGEPLSIRALMADDPLHPVRVTTWLTPENPAHLRYLARRRQKRSPGQLELNVDR